MGGKWGSVASMFASLDGWHAKAPQIVRSGCFVLPPVRKLWRSFCRLSRGRAASPFGGVAALTYRDIRDEAERAGWRNSEEAEDLLTALDDAYLKAATEAQS